jgi:hypothetical protein
MARGQKWKLRAAGLAEAAEFLELTLPVKIRATNQTRSRGKYVWWEGQTEHTVRLSTYLDAKTANKTLMHELVHAHQWERAYVGHECEIAAGKAEAQFDADRAGPYASRASELEADVMAEVMAEEFTAVVHENWSPSFG